MTSDFVALPDIRLIRALKGVALIGSAIVIIGWYFNLGAVVAPYGPFGDVRLDSILCLFGLALAHVVPRRGSQVSLGLIGVVGITALFTLLGYTLRFSQPFDLIAERMGLLSVSRSAGLHMPFVTSLAVLLICLAMILQRLPQATALQSAFSCAGALLAPMAMGQNLMSQLVFGTDQDLAGTHDASLQTTALIAVIGAGLALEALHKLRPDGYRRLDHYYAWSVLALAATALLAWDVEEQNDWNDRAFETSVALNYVSTDVQSKILALGAGQQRLARRWAIYGAPTQAEWDNDASSTLSISPGIFSIAYVDPYRVVRWRVATSGDLQEFLGMKLDDDPLRKLAFDTADRTRTLHMTQTIKLADGTLTRLFLTPLYDVATPEGYLLASVHMKDLAQFIPENVKKDFNVEIHDEAGTSLDAGQTSFDLGTRVRKTTHFATFGQYWTVTVWPNDAYILAHRSLLLQPTLLFGSLITFLVAAALSQTRQSQIALRREAQATAQLANTVAHISDGFVTVDRNWRMTYANNEAALYFGFATPEAMIGTVVMKPDDPTEVPEKVVALNRAMDGTGTGHFVERTRKTGRWLDVTAYPTGDGFSMFLRDVTEARERDQHLRLLETAIARQNDVVIITDAEDREGADSLRIVYVNDAFTRLTGYSREEVIGKTPRILQGPKTNRADLDRIRAAIVDLTPIQIELINYAKDGTEYWIEMDIAPIIDSTGVCTHFVTVERDLTHRKQIEAEAFYSQARFQNIVDATNDIIWEADLATSNVRYNENLNKILGYDPVAFQYTTRDWESWVHPDDVARVTKVIEDAIANPGATVEMEYKIRKSNGSYAAILDRAKVIRDADGKAVRILGAMADISERRAMDDRLRQSQQLEAVGQLTGGVAHDFNNLLTVILGNSELLVDRLEAQPKLQKLAEMTVTMALRGSELTSRLLAFARRQPLDPKRIDVNALVISMEDWMRRTLPETISIKIATAADVWTIEADPNQLENALLNLAVNARDAMPQGGHLYIETGNAEITEDCTKTLPEAKPGSYVHLSIRDTGTGMDAETLGRAFEPFFTTKAMGKGSGLGLSMVYGFVRQSAGFAMIESGVGKGTTVHLYFPRAARDEGARKHHADGHKIVGGSEHVLVVEDDESVLESAIVKLDGLGYRVSSAMAGTAALEIIRNDPSIDLLFTDIVMPGDLSGPELVKRASAIRPDLKVLYTSGYTDDTIIHDGKLDPGLTLLTKPYRLKDMAEKIRSVLDA